MLHSVGEEHREHVALSGHVGGGQALHPRCEDAATTPVDLRVLLVQLVEGLRKVLVAVLVAIEHADEDRVVNAIGSLHVEKLQKKLGGRAALVFDELHPDLGRRDVGGPLENAAGRLAVESGLDHAEQVRHSKPRPGDDLECRERRGAWGLCKGGGSMRG